MGLLFITSWPPQHRLCLTVYLPVCLFYIFENLSSVVYSSADGRCAGTFSTPGLPESVLLRERRIVQPAFYTYWLRLGFAAHLRRARFGFLRTFHVHCSRCRLVALLVGDMAFDTIFISLQRAVPNKRLLCSPSLFSTTLLHTYYSSTASYTFTICWYGFYRVLVGLVPSAHADGAYYLLRLNVPSFFAVVTWFGRVRNVPVTPRSVGSRWTLLLPQADGLKPYGAGRRRPMRWATCPSSAFSSRRRCCALLLFLCRC